MFCGLTVSAIFWVRNRDKIMNHIDRSYIGVFYPVSEPRLVKACVANVEIEAAAARQGAHGGPGSFCGQPDKALPELLVFVKQYVEKLLRCSSI
jgi:hypothetical protein